MERKRKSGEFQENLLYDVVHDYIITENFAFDTEGANKVMLKLSDELMQEIYERTMTASEKRKDTMLKKKYDDSDMKKNMQAQYGKEEGKKVYFATIRKQAMKKEEVEVVDEAKYEKGASDYGKTSIRNKRAFGKGGNARPPEERGAAIDARQKAHKEKRGVKTKVKTYHYPFELKTEATRYAKETGKSFKSGKPVTKGGTAKNDKAFQAVAKKYASQMMGGPQKKKVRGQKPDESNTPFKRAAARIKQTKIDNKALADKAKKAGYKSTQDYVNVQAVRKGGLGT